MMRIMWNNLSVGGIAIAFGILLFLFREWMPGGIIIISAILVAVGSLSVAVALLQSKGIIDIPDNRDERLLKIRAHTFMKAFFFSFMVVCILGILDYSGLVVMRSRSIIEILFFTMGLSAFALSWYYNRQGDVIEE